MNGLGMSLGVVEEERRYDWLQLVRVGASNAESEEVCRSLS